MSWLFHMAAVAVLAGMPHGTWQRVSEMQAHLLDADSLVCDPAGLYYEVRLIQDEIMLRATDEPVFYPGDSLPFEPVLENFFYHYGRVFAHKTDDGYIVAQNAGEWG